MCLYLFLNLFIFQKLFEINLLTLLLTFHKFLLSIEFVNNFFRAKFLLEILGLLNFIGEISFLFELLQFFKF